MLMRHGNEIECNYLMPPMFYINETWVKFTPNLAIGGSDPEILTPQTKPTWTYFKPQALALTGIYTRADLERLKDRIMMPLEKGPILNSVALGMAGRTYSDPKLSIKKFLDEEVIEHIAKSTWSKMWTSFLTFGTASAGILGIFILIRVIKIIIDTIIHGYAIYSIYGFSLHLIGALWNSVTQLLLHLGRNIQERGKEALQKYDEEGRLKEEQLKEKAKNEDNNQSEEDTAKPNKQENVYEKLPVETIPLYPRLSRSGSTMNLPTHINQQKHDNK